jgi:hypothetical protein
VETPRLDVRMVWPASYCDDAYGHCVHSIQYSLLHPVLVNPVLSLIRPKTDGDKPVN